MNKKLQRDTKNKVIGGVCSGLANYFEIDVSLIRVLFAIALLIFGSGFGVYIVLWIIIPEADAGSDAETNTTADSLVSDVGKNSGEKRSSLVAGLILIFLGAFGLVHRYVPQVDWRTLWPVLLIVLGLFLIIPFKTKKS